MKRKAMVMRSTVAGVLLGALLMLPSCRADVDLSDLDPEAKLQLGLALPVGELKMTINDFLKGDLKDMVGVDEDGLLFYEDTFLIERDFHDIDLTKYMTNTKKQFKIGDAVPALVGYAIPAGTEVVLEFPMSLALNDVNTALDDERIDSIYIHEARFSTVLSLTDLDLPYESIEKLELVLGDNVRRAKGNTVEIPLTGAGYDDNIDILIDEFTINLMKDRTQEPSSKNVINEMNFLFRFTIKPEKNIPVTSNSSIDYDFRIQFLDYNALWGFFKPSNLMHDQDSIHIADEWPGWTSIQRFNLKLAEPTITIHATQALGCPLTTNLSYFYVKSEEENRTEYATFNGNQRYIWAMPLFVDPQTAPIGETVTNTLVLDHTESNGRLDKLFDVRPDDIGYKFEIMINQSYSSTVKQHRLTKNTNIDIEAIIHLPFIFNPGVEIEYTDTLKDINISQSKIDSIIDNSKVIDSVYIDTIRLVLMAKNTIPFNVHLGFRFFTESGEELHFKSLEEDGMNTLIIPGPTRIENRVVMDPGLDTLVLRIGQDEYDKLESLRYIVYTAFLGENTTSVRLLDRSDLRVKIGLTADVDAYLRFAAEEDEDEE